MSDPTPDPRTGGPTSRRWPLLAVAALAVALVAGAGWYFFLRDDSPAEFDIDTAAEGVGEQDGDGEDGSEPDDDTSTTTEGTSTATDGVAGTWTIDASAAPATDGEGEGEGASAGFRVDEELANVGAATAVGRTPGVEGSLVIEDTTVTSVEVTVDLTRLESNDSRRDDRMLEALAVEEFPTASFTLTEPIELGSVPEEGETISVTAVGEMTIKGETNDVEIGMDARRVDGVLVVVGSTPVVFADHGVEPPSAPIVVSVDDEGTIEFQLYFTRS